MVNRDNGLELSKRWLSLFYRWFCYRCMKSLVSSLSTDHSLYVTIECFHLS